ncbi:MAG: hypothetical protein K940chlam5_01400 [Candidatus Anoxychlamydiales bacterium]|nr:hypothetical protein [Candidatus Anoxychlamydiales bacterium]
MRILITGSSGRIGNAVASSLKDKHSVIGIDINPGEHTTYQLK